MPAVDVDIQPEIIRWALNQTQEEKLGDKLLENIKKWLNGTKMPTFNQIDEFSRKSNIPLGYFFLQTPPDEKIGLLEYRTVDSIQLINPSRNLIDTVHYMEDVQDWMRGYRQDLGFGELSVVGCLRDGRDAATIATRLREDFELKENWITECGNSREAFELIRQKLEEYCVVVMMSGIVGKNTHRTLDVDEFRAFAMVDEWAPLIFINAADSEGAKLFSLLHEVIHIWLGENDLYNDRKEQPQGVSQLEMICNAAAAELLVPQQVFLEKWSDSAEDLFEEIRNLAKYFRCGESVIARRAMDFGKISQTYYNRVVQNAIDFYAQMKENKKNSGGDYYNSQGSRLDRCFVRALCESVSMGRTSYTEAYRLTNTSSKTFFEVAHRLGGELWQKRDS